MVYGKPERARDYLKLLVKLRPSDSRPLRTLAHSELDSGNPKLATELLENSLQMAMSRQERAATFLLLGRSLRRLQRFEDSKKAINAFIRERELIDE